MLVPIELLNNEFISPLNRFLSEKVEHRRSMIASNLSQIFKVVFDLLKEVELLEPRFSCTLLQHDSSSYQAYCKGLKVISPTEFEIILYLNQMGVFNLQEETNVPGCVALKLCEGSKRSMSLWVEYITASGYLSRPRIVALFIEHSNGQNFGNPENKTFFWNFFRKKPPANKSIGKVCRKSTFSNVATLVSDPYEVKLRIHDVFTVVITPAFRYYSASWPRCAYNWPTGYSGWPHYSIIEQIKREGFDLCSKESGSGHSSNSDQNNQLEGDFWMLDFSQAEDRLLNDIQRRKCLSILKTLRDRHLDLPSNPITNYHLKTLLLFECEKHCSDGAWIDLCLPYRVNGILLQLISCLQQRFIPHYFMPQTNLFRNKSTESLENASRQAWILVRHLLTNSFSFDFL